MTSLVRRHPFTAFVVLAYFLTWLLHSPWVLARNGLGLLPYELPAGAPIQLVLLAGTFGPFIAGLVVTHVTEGTVRPLLHRLVRFRAPARVYLVAWVGITAAVAVPMMLSPGPAGPSQSPIRAMIMLVVVFVVGVLSGPLGEEPGWRGVGLPLLQRRLHPAAAAMVLGLVWTFWHLPQAFTREWDTPHGTPADLLGFLVFAVSSSVILSWIVNTAAGAVGPAILGHALLNIAPYAVGLLTGRRADDVWPPALGLLALAAIALAVTKGRLGAPDDPTDDARDGDDLPRGRAT